MENKLPPEIYKDFIEYTKKKFSNEFIEEKLNELYQEISNLYQNTKDYFLGEMLIKCGKYCGHESICEKLQGQKKTTGLLCKDDEERLIADLNAVCGYVFVKFLGEVLALEAMGEENSNIDEWAENCPSYDMMGDMIEMKNLCGGSDWCYPDKTIWILLKVNGALKYLSEFEYSEKGISSLFT